MENNNQQHIELSHLTAVENVGFDGQPVPAGPAVFVANLERLDAGELRGGWIALDRGTEAVRIAITDAVGATAVASARWSIIDQIGMGDTMLPEALSPEELRQAAIRQAAVVRHPSSFCTPPELTLIHGQGQPAQEAAWPDVPA